MAKTKTKKPEEISTEMTDETPENGSDYSPPDRLWLLSGGLIAALAAFLRFFWIELKPLHHDEGVNGFFLKTLYDKGVYHYDPSNYHGPDLYYLSVAFSKVLGLNTASVRWSVAVFGFLTVVLALYLRRYIGKLGSLAAALFLALSPGMVYVSRYFIHEILFVFLSLAIVVAVVLFLDRQKAGIGAAVWMTLLLVVCFMPASLMGISAVGFKSMAALWSMRVGIVLVEALLIFFVMRMLLNWRGGRPMYLMLASASAVLLYATKETAFITHGTMIIALVCVILWSRLNDVEAFVSKRRFLAIGLSGLAVLFVFGGIYTKSDGVREFYRWLYDVFAHPEVSQEWLFYTILLSALLSGAAYLVFLFRWDSRPDGAGIVEPAYFVSDESGWEFWDWLLVWVACGTVFIYLLTLFFTSFFHYPGDFLNFFSAYAFWAKTGSKDHTQSGFFGYAKWLLEIEAPLIFLSVLGTLIAVIRGKQKFALFAGLWAFGLFLAYSIISYKTPWLALSFTLPMCIAAGYAVGEFVSSTDNVKKILGGVLAAVSVLILTFQTYDLNFVRYDDEKMPYVYAHTERGFEDLIRDIKRYAEKSSKKENASIDVVSDEYWPMPWYMKDYPKALFHGGLIDATTSEIIVAKDGQLEDLPDRYASHYKYIRTYPLRPGVELYLLVRNDLAGSEGKNLYEIKRGN